MAINEKSILLCHKFSCQQRNQWNRRPYVYFTRAAANNRQTDRSNYSTAVHIELSVFEKEQDSAKWSILFCFFSLLVMNCLQNPR